MSFRKRFMWMVIATIFTTILATFMNDLTVALVIGLPSNLFSYFLMMLIAAVALVIANLPAVGLLYWQQYPRAVLVGCMAAVEGFLISCILTPFSVGASSWATSMYVSVLAGYLLVDMVVNRPERSRKQKITRLVATFSITTLLVFIFLLG
jgi:hypothetical protein